jgi:hypothetical protein
VTGFTVRVDNVEKNESGGTWDVRGKVTWDLGDENATAATGVGMAMGLVNMMSGGTIIDGVGMAANVASESYKQIGKCLTSTSLGDVPKTQISVNLKGVNIANLEGVKEGAFITVTGASILPFKPYQGLFGDRASSFSTPGNNSYGEIVVYGQDGSATFAGEKISTKEFCRTK